MHKCPHQGCRKDFCQECVYQVQGHQGKILDQFSKRLNYIWKKSDDIHKQVILKSEEKFPLAATQVLATFPVKDDTDLEEYSLAINKAVKVLKELKKEFGNAKIRWFDNSFILYSDIEIE